MRAQFESDKQLISWCDLELGMHAGIAQELIIRATVAETAKDAATWVSVGGFTSVRQVAVLPKKQQLHVVQSAVAQSKSVRSVMREQGLISKPVHQPQDAEVLAAFIRGLDVKIPANIREILNKYTIALSQSRAA